MTTDTLFTLRLAPAQSAALREADDVPVSPEYHRSYERSLAAVRTRLGDDAFASAWAEGRALSVDAAIALALAHPESIVTAPVDVQILPDGLTPREVDVLGPLAAGLSHREIAEALVVSVRTVGRHIDNIYGKIGVHDRRQARQYARAHGLLAPMPAAGT